MKTANKFIPPLAGVAAFVGPYAKNSGGLSQVPEAILNDIKNFSPTDATNRLKDRTNQKEIAIPLLGGVAVEIVSKELLKGNTRKLGQLAGKTAKLYGVGKLAKVILDPPPSQPISNSKALASPCTTERPLITQNNPYDTGGY